MVPWRSLQTNLTLGDHLKDSRLCIQLHLFWLSSFHLLLLFTSAFASA